MRPRVYRIGTRGSKLALAQTTLVIEKAKALHPHSLFEVVPIKTSGDIHRDLSLTRMPYYGVFVREIQKALINGDIDAGVHSLKDLPLQSDPSIYLAAIPEREEVCDIFIGKRYGSIEELPADSRVGTGSMRRAVLLKRLRPDIEIVNIRGNLDTRLRKLEEGDYDGLIVALAGVKRLGLLDAFAVQKLDPFEFPPAPNQGAIGVEVRRDDEDARSIFSSIDSPDNRRAITAERIFLELTGGGCRFPMGAFASRDGGEWRMVAFVSSPDGSRFFIETMEGDEPLELSRNLFDRIMESGGADIIKAIKGER